MRPRAEKLLIYGVIELRNRGIGRADDGTLNGAPDGPMGGANADPA